MKTLNATPHRLVALGTLSVMTMSAMLANTAPAQAGSGTWKKVAIGAGIVTGYGLLKGKGKIATIGGVATAGSYYMYKKSKNKEESERYAPRRGRDRRHR